MAESSQAQIIALYENVLRLKRLPRTGWLFAGVTLPESVAEHSFGTALLACVLAEQINADSRERGASPPLDVGRVAVMGLVHDLAESIVTDLPKVATAQLGPGVKHRAEREAIDSLLYDVAGGVDFATLWHEYSSGESAEARLVRDADKLEMVLQARAYASAGNKNLDEFWSGHEWSYQFSRDLFQSLYEERVDSRTDVTE